MSNIGILTFLHNGNYGSSLQAYALQRVIREMGYDCEHINYQPDTGEKIRNLLCSGNSPALLLEGMKKRKVQGAQAGLREKRKRILGFYTRAMRLSPLCRNEKELKRIAEGYDLLVCGSDQIWNPIWMNPAYFLDFAAADKPRIAYAPSLGISRTPSRRKQRIMRRLLPLFDAVSVREEEGARILVSVTGSLYPVMPDPVCLLTAEEWEEAAADMPEREPYLLCYFIGERPDYWEKVRRLCAETGLKPLVIPVTAESYAQREFPLLDGAGPEEFLGAVRDAESLCTDSFHGLAFGTIFQKRVELIRRDAENDKNSNNSRTEHFLRQVRAHGLTAMRNEGREWLHEQLTALSPLQ